MGYNFTGMEFQALKTVTLPLGSFENMEMKRSLQFLGTLEPEHQQTFWDPRTTLSTGASALSVHSPPQAGSAPSSTHSLLIPPLPSLRRARLGRQNNTSTPKNQTRSNPKGSCCGFKTGRQLLSPTHTFLVSTSPEKRDSFLLSPKTSFQPFKKPLCWHRTF